MDANISEGNYPDKLYFELGDYFQIKEVDGDSERTYLVVVTEYDDEAEDLGSGGGDESGTDNYNELTNKPSINRVPLVNNKTGEQLGLVDLELFKSAIAQYYTQEQVDSIVSNIFIPTKTSEIENDSEFVNNTTMQTALDTKVDKTNVYTKTETYNRAETYNKNEANNILTDKVDVEDFNVFSEQTNNKLTNINDELVNINAELDNINNELDNIPNNYYNKTQTDTIVDNIFIPTKTSDLQNDSSFINNTTLQSELLKKSDKLNTYTKIEIDNLIAESMSSTFIFIDRVDTLDDLPTNLTENERGYFYSVGLEGSDTFLLRVWNGFKWISFGNTTIDLSNYYTKGETYSKSEIEALLLNKVDKTDFNTFISEMNNTITDIDNDIVNLSNNTYRKTETYNQTEIDDKINNISLTADNIKATNDINSPTVYEEILSLQENKLDISQNSFHELNDVMPNPYDVGALYLSYKGQQIPYSLFEILDIKSDEIIMSNTNEQNLSIANGQTGLSTKIAFNTSEGVSESYEADIADGAFIIKKTNSDLQLFAQGLAKILTNNQWYGAPVTFKLELYVNDEYVLSSETKEFLLPTTYVFDFLSLTKNDIENALGRSLNVGDKLYPIVTWTRAEPYSDWSVVLNNVKFSLINMKIAGEKTGIHIQKTVGRGLTISKASRQSIIGNTLIDYDFKYRSNNLDIVYNQQEKCVDINLTDSSDFYLFAPTPIINTSTTIDNNVSFTMLIEKYDDTDGLYKTYNVSNNTLTANIKSNSIEPIIFRKSLSLKTGKYKIYLILSSDNDDVCEINSISKNITLGDNVHISNEAPLLTIREISKV